VTKSDTIAENSNISDKKYDNIAKMINSDDSIIAECEWYLQCFNINVGINPNNNPIKFDSILSTEKSKITTKRVSAPISVLSSGYTKPFIV